MASIDQTGNTVFYQEIGSADYDRNLIPLIVQHGLAQWGDDWVNAGWISYFGDRRVIAVDGLGHGRSDRPTTRTEYSMEKRAEAVLRVADAEGIDRFAFFGFSMGGRVGFELVASEPGRVEKLIVGGMHGLKPAIDRKNLERRIAVLRSNKWSLVERAVGAKRGDGRSNDPEALALSTEAVLDWHGAEDRLPQVSAPALLYCGAQDTILEYARKTANLMPGSEFLELPNTTHAASFYTSEVAKIAVRDFLA